jgi:lysophospholipase L1-like esterase
MKRILLAAVAVCLAGAAAVTFKALRYRRDAQTWHARWAALQADPAGLARYRDDNLRVRQTPRRSKRVVFLGASITEGLDLRAIAPDAELINRGVGAQLIWQQWLRLDDDALSLQPTAVVLKVCAINFLPGTPPLEQAQRTFALMADTVRARGVRVVMATAVPVTRGYDHGDGDGHVRERLVRFNAWVREQAAAHHDLLLDYAAALEDPEHYLPERYSDDGLHPNTEGKRLMADAIRRVVIEGHVRAPDAPSP